MISINYRFAIISIIFCLSIIYTYPNLHGEDPAIIINKKSENIDIKKINKNLEIHNVKKKSIIQKNNEKLIIRFFSTEEQFSAYEILKNTNYHISLNIINSPSIEMFEKIGAYPMKLGLDLRGGVHLLIKVITKNTTNNYIKAKINTIKNDFKKNQIKYKNIKKNRKNVIKIYFDSIKETNIAMNNLTNMSSDFDIISYKNKNIKIKLNKNKKKEIKKQIIEQTIYILSKRINELGISDSIIQAQGKNKIIIEIPGIQDISRAKNILGKTATLSFMLVDTENSIKRALNGKIPKYSKIFYQKNNIPILLKNKNILTGDAIIHASAGFEQQLNKPCINIKLNEKNIDLFQQTTRKNIGNPLAIVYKESIINESKNINFKETVISVATIMNALGKEFQITGLNIQESKDLALLLRSGALPTTISIIEEKIIGPSLGEKNIKSGLISVTIAFIAILIFMLINYKILGLIANIALITNLILLTAIMSIIGVTITLPGIAGIVLTIGMSIDANILIFERIKEEIINEQNYKYGIEKGFINAFSSIIDSNLTTLIIGIILFSLSNGPIKGFAITLSIGILTSIYSAIFVTKTITDTLLRKKIQIIKNEYKLYKN